MNRLAFTIVVALLLWTLMFSPLTAPHLNFWATMSCSALLLSLLGSWFGRGWWHRVTFSPGNLLLGVAIAAGLWLLFWTGDKLSQMMFDFARPQVNLIYGMKEGENPLLLTLLMLLLIGPAEEIFWRGYVQQTLGERYGANTGFVAATALYALVHVGALNFMLLMAALVAGTVWGALYRLFPGRFAAIILSHALWDAAVFIWFPI